MSFWYYVLSRTGRFSLTYGRRFDSIVSIPIAILSAQPWRTASKKATRIRSGRSKCNSYWVTHTIRPDWKAAIQLRIPSWKQERKGKRKEMIREELHECYVKVLSVMIHSEWNDWIVVQAYSLEMACLNALLGYKSLFAILKMLYIRKEKRRNECNWFSQHQFLLIYCWL
jgi:hypothetical protein